MTRSPLVSLSVMAAVLGAGSVLAEESSPLLKTNAPPPRATTPAQPRAISPTVNAQLTAATPKFDPAHANTTPVVAPKTIEPGTDLREIDKPRNTIIRLPEYVVQEQTPPVIKERDLATPKARLELALKKNPGLNLGSFWIFRNDGVAMAMLEEEERLERMKEAHDLLTLLPASQQKQLKPVVDQTFMRQ